MALLAHGLVLALLAPALMLCGELAQRLRLPLITGYVLGGILVGPQGLNLLREEALAALLPIESACLAIIAFSAGTELQMGDLRKIRKQVWALFTLKVAYITLGVAAWTWAAVFGALTLLAPSIPLLRALPPRQAEAVAALAATLCIARSPASMVAVLKETEGKGPYCSLISAVVVVKDVLVFVAFAINIELAHLAMRDVGAGFTAAHLTEPALSLLSSGAVGVVAGMAAGRTLGMGLPARWPLGWPQRLIPAGSAPRAKAAAATAAVAGWALGAFALATGLRAEPLLACVLTGVVSSNRRGETGGRSVQEDVQGALQSLLPGVNMAFFALTGASLALGSVVRTVWAAGIVWLARLGAVYVGSWSGAWLGGTPQEARRRVWQGMVTQAGVAMGLARAVGAKFPSWGPEFVAIMVSVIMANLLVGPLLFRAAVVAMGEARALPLHSGGPLGGPLGGGDRQGGPSGARTPPPPMRSSSATPRVTRELREASGDLTGAAAENLKERTTVIARDEVSGDGTLLRGHDRGGSGAGPDFGGLAQV